MNRLAALSASLCVLAPRLADEIHLADAPHAGETRALAFASELELEGGELFVLMNGAEVPEMFLPTLNLTVSDRKRLVVADAFDAEGWVRTYDRLAWSDSGAMEMSGPGGDQSFPWSADLETPLEGRAVRFAGSADGAPAAVGFADEREGDTALLEGLRAELGLGVLLPAERVELGASWDVEGDALALLFEPGGRLGWEVPPEAAQNLMPEILWTRYEGELELVLTALERGLARCSVSGEIARVSGRPGDLTQVPVVDGTATDTVTETWDVAGELVWNVALRRLERLDLDGAFEQETVTERDPDQPGDTYESTFTVGGRRSLRAAGASAAEDAGTALDAR